MDYRDFNIFLSRSSSGELIVEQQHQITLNIFPLYCSKHLILKLPRIKSILNIIHSVISDMFHKKSLKVTLQPK